MSFALDSIRLLIPFCPFESGFKACRVCGVVLLGLSVSMKGNNKMINKRF